MPRRRRSTRSIALSAGGSLLPERSTTILETVLKPLQILDIPQQAVFRGVRALEEGSFSALGEQTRLSDIAPVERGGVGEFVGTIALDPLNFVGGVFAKTATGAARKTLTTALRDTEVLTSQLRAAKLAAKGARITKGAKTTGILEQVAGIERELNLTREAAVTARVELARVSRGAKGSTISQSTLNPDRALLRLDIPFTNKGIDIGSTESIPKLLTSSRLNKQRRRVDALRRKVARGTRAPEVAPKVVPTLAFTRKFGEPVKQPSDVVQQFFNKLEGQSTQTGLSKSHTEFIHFYHDKEIWKKAPTKQFVIGTLDDIITHPTLRKSLEDVLDVQVRVGKNPAQGVDSIQGSGVIHGAFAAGKGGPGHIIITRGARGVTDESLTNTILEEAAHALQKLKGRKLSTVDEEIKLIKTGEYATDKLERVAKKFVDVLTSRRKKFKLDPGLVPNVKDVSKLAKLERALLQQPEGVLNKYSPALAVRVAKARSFLRKNVGDRFSTVTGNEKFDVLREIRTNRRTGRALAFRDKPLKRFSKELDELFKNSEVKDLKQFNEQMTENFEFRQFFGKEVDLPSVQTAIDEEVAARMNKEFFGEGGQGLVAKYENIPISDIPRMQRNFMAEEAIDVGLKQDNLRQQLDKMVKVRGRVTAAEIRFVNNWGEHFDEVLDIEKAIGINIEKESGSGGWLSYLTRVTTKDALKLKKKDAGRFGLIQNDVTAHLANAMKRKMYPKSDIVSINELMRTKHGIEFDWFDTDVTKIITKRFDKHIESTGNAQMAHAMFDIFGEEGKNLQKGISQEKYFKKIGMTGGRDDLFISDSMMLDAQRAQDMISEVNKAADTVTAQIVGWVDQNINTFYRSSLTAFFPPFHNRNFIGNIMLMRQSGISFRDIGKFLSKMRRLQRRALTGELSTSEAKLWQQLADMRIRGEGQLTDIERGALKRGTLQGFNDLTDQPIKTVLRSITKRKFEDAPEVINVPSLLGFKGVPDNPITSFGVGRSYGILIEEQARGAMYLANRAKGLSPLDSQRAVNKYLFDYQALSPFEQKRLAPMFLFYTWSRKNIPLQMKEMIQNPRFANVFQNITGYDQEDAPLYLRNGVSFPVPGLKDTFVGTLGLPLEDLSFLSVSDTDPNVASQLKRATQRMLTRLAPAFRVPVEFMTGVEAFSQRSLRNTKMFANPFTNFRDFQNSFLVKNSPFSRAIRTAGDIADPEDPAASKLLEFLYGLRNYRVSPEKIRLTNIKQRLLSTDEFKRPDPTLVVPIQPKEERSDITNARAKALNAALRELKPKKQRRRGRRRR